MEKENIQLSAVNMELTEELKIYIDKKMRSLEKFINFDDPSVSGDIRLYKDTGKQSGKIYRVEMSIMTAGKKYGINADGNTLYEAIDEAKDLILRKIAGYREKRQSIVKRGGVKVKAFLKKFSR